MEPHSLFGREARAVRAAAPAQVVQRERVLQRRAELLRRAGDDKPQLAELTELPQPAAVQVAALGRRLGAIDRVEAGAEVENGGLDSFDQLQPGGAVSGYTLPAQFSTFHG